MIFSERRAKIVATLGPATDIPKVLERMIGAGLDVARLNMSHGTHADHRRRVQWVRRLSKKAGRTVAVLMDLGGPKIRTGLLRNHRLVHLIKNNKIEITTRNITGDETRISTNYRLLPRDVKKGDPILLDDGKMKLEVVSRTSSSVKARVLHGGWLKENAGMNLPGTHLSLPALTAKDLDDLKFGMEAGVDAIALSFVRRARDVVQLKKILRRKKFFVPVIAKIECSEALVRFEEILEAAEGVMVARGDLGVEISLEKVPVLQKRIIAKANEFGKVVITATQMLESMVDSPSPTRAEASDVANAIFDGTDCVMLSGETAKGKYPVESVHMMGRIIREAEATAHRRGGEELHKQSEHSLVHAVVHAACHAAEEVNAKAILVFSMTGTTVRKISKLKPKKPILGLTPHLHAHRQMALYWGVHPVMSPSGHSTDEMIRQGERVALRQKILKKGDEVVVVSGTQLLRGATNMMKILKLS